MIELAELSWRAYPAALLILFGLAAAAWSIRRAVRRALRSRDPWRALAIARGFRIAIVALAVAAIGAAWWWQSAPLFGLALVIGGEELLESSVVIKALEHGLPGARDAKRPRPRNARWSSRDPADRGSHSVDCAACRA
jgi:branched-subunit amino acid ABC-type transport system permease component